MNVPGAAVVVSGVPDREPRNTKKPVCRAKTPARAAAETPAVAIERRLSQATLDVNTAETQGILAGILNKYYNTRIFGISRWGRQKLHLSVAHVHAFALLPMHPYPDSNVARIRAFALLSVHPYPDSNVLSQA